MTFVQRSISGVVVLAVISGFFYYFYIARTPGSLSPGGQWVCQEGAWVASGTPSAVAPNIPCVKVPVGGVGLDVASTTPTAANIIVRTPTANSAVPFPFLIEGSARTFEGSVDIRLRDSDDQVIYEGYTTAQASDAGKFGAFRAPIEYLFHKPASDAVTLEVFERSAKDGSEINKVVTPIKLALGETANVKLFFENSDLVASGKDPCGRVFPVERVVPKVPGLIRRVLELLDKGPSASEFEKGYQTELNPDVNIQEFTVDEGRARVDFDAQLMKDVTQVCRFKTLEAQILQTLSQFSEVVDAGFTVNGVEPEKFIVNQ